MSRKWFGTLFVVLLALFATVGASAQVKSEDYDRSAAKTIHQEERTVGPVVSPVLKVLQEERIARALGEATAIALSVERLDASPEKVRRLIKSYYKLISEGHSKEEVREKGEKTRNALEALPIVLKDGKRVSQRAISEKLQKLLTKEVIESLDLSPESLWEISPFRELGEIPVTTKSSKADLGFALRSKDIALLVHSSSEKRIPVFGEDVESNTYWITYSNGWNYYWILFVGDFIKWWAKTEAFVSGWDAANSVYPYSIWKLYCLQTNIPFETRQIYCRLARQAPMIRFNAFYLYAEICVQFAPPCRYKTGYFTQEVKASASEWLKGLGAGLLLWWEATGADTGVHSHHHIRLFPHSDLHKFEIRN